MTDYLTIAETAEMFSVSTRTVRRWIEDGTVKAYRVGRRLLRIDIDSISGVYEAMPTKLQNRRAALPTQPTRRVNESKWQKRAYRELRELREEQWHTSQTAPQTQQLHTIRQISNIPDYRTARVSTTTSTSI